MDSPLVLLKAAQRFLAASEMRRRAFADSRLRGRAPVEAMAARCEWILLNIEITS